MKNSNSFIKTIEDPEHGWMWNGKPNKKLGGTRVEVSNKQYVMSPSIRYEFVHSFMILWSPCLIWDMDKVVFRVKLN